MYYQGSSEDYIPSLQEMPDGFDQDYTASGPLSIPDTDTYVQAYYRFQTPGNKLEGAAFVGFWVMVCKDEKVAKSQFNSIPTLFDTMTRQNTPLSEFDEYMVLAEIQTTDLMANNPPGLGNPADNLGLDSTSESVTYAIAVKEKNVVIIVTASAMVGDNLGFETGLVAEDVLQEAVYYTSMVMKKLNSK